MRRGCRVDGDPGAARRKIAAAGADVIDLGCLPDTPFPVSKMRCER